MTSHRFLSGLVEEVVPKMSVVTRVLVWRRVKTTALKHPFGLQNATIGRSMLQNPEPHFYQKG